MTEENGSPPRVLGQNAINSTQYFNGAVRDVGEIPDGSTDNIELSYALVVVL